MKCIAQNPDGKYPRTLLVYRVSNVAVTLECVRHYSIIQPSDTTDTQTCVVFVTDPRTTTWFMLDSPWHVWHLSVAYLLFVWLGPKYLRDKKPYDLRIPMTIHNIAMVVFSTYMCIEVRLQQASSLILHRPGIRALECFGILREMFSSIVDILWHPYAANLRLVDGVL